MLPFAPRNAINYATNPQLDTPRLTKRKVSKCLFGRMDPAESRSWFADQFKAIEDESKKRWNFDFTIDAPACHPSSSNQEWAWKPVDQASVPAFYRTKVLSSPENVRPPQSGQSQANSASGTAIRHNSGGSGAPKNCQFRPIHLPVTPSGKRCLTLQDLGSSPSFSARKRLRCSPVIAKPKPMRLRISDVYRSCKRVSCESVVKNGADSAKAERPSPSKIARVSAKP